MPAKTPTKGHETPLIAPGHLRGRTWKRFLRGPDPDLLETLYVPALCAYYWTFVLVTRLSMQV